MGRISKQRRYVIHVTGLDLLSLREFFFFWGGGSSALVSLVLVDVLG